MVKALLTINIVPDKMNQVVRDIREIKGVERAHMVFGIYDVITEVRTQNVKQLRGLILKIRKMPNVYNSLIQIVEQEKKQ